MSLQRMWIKIKAFGNESYFWLLAGEFTKHNIDDGRRTANAHRSISINIFRPISIPNQRFSKRFQSKKNILRSKRYTHTQTHAMIIPMCGKDWKKSLWSIDSRQKCLIPRRAYSQLFWLCVKSKEWNGEKEFTLMSKHKFIHQNDAIVQR